MFLLKRFNRSTPFHLLVVYSKQITATFSSNTLREAGFLINNVIDFEQCAKEGKLVVKDDVDEELDGLKRKYAGLGDFLNQTAHTISSLIESPHATSSLNVIYFPVSWCVGTTPTTNAATAAAECFCQYWW